MFLIYHDSFINTLNLRTSTNKIIFSTVCDAMNWAKTTIIDGNIYYFLARNLISKRLGDDLKHATIRDSLIRLDKVFNVIRHKKVGKRDYVRLTHVVNEQYQNYLKSVLKQYKKELNLKKKQKNRDSNLTQNKQFKNKNIELLCEYLTFDRNIFHQKSINTIHSALYQSDLTLDVAQSLIDHITSLSYNKKIKHPTKYTLKVISNSNNEKLATQFVKDKNKLNEDQEKQDCYNELQLKKREAKLLGKQIPENLITKARKFGLA